MSAVSANCTACNEPLGLGARFCEDCGTPAAAQPAAAAATPAAVPAATPAAAPAAAAAPAPAVAAAAIEPPVPATVRGVIMRDTNAGPGMILVNGVKKTFTLEQHWQGTVAPQVQMQADVTLDPQGEIVAIVPARAGLEDLEKYKALAKKAVDGGTPVLADLVGRIGKPVLAAMLVVIVSWLWLPAINVTIMAGMKQSATLFDLLRLANSGASLQNFGQSGGSSGLYGFICFLAMFAPLLPTFLKHKHARLGYFGPLAFLALTGLMIYMQMRSMTSAARDSMRALGGSRMDEMADAMMQQVSNALSIGFGTYLSLAAALYLAWRGIDALRKAR